MTNAFVYLQLQTRDVPGAQEFYSRMFDWGLDEDTSSPVNYTEIDTRTGPRAGLMASPTAGGQSKWLPYIEVQSLNKALQRLEQLGGSIMSPATHAGEKGIYAIVSDPDGAQFALWESG